MTRLSPRRLIANPLVVGGTMIAVTLVGVLAAGGFDQPQDRPAGGPVAVRDLRFEDRADGGVAILDVRAGTTVSEIAPGEGGFVRATLRGLARERKREEIGRETPFRLTVWGDGRLTLEDPATGRFVDLGAFGQTQVATFARLVTAGRNTP
ncbi:photosynthetic complex assembly protein PuhC [Elioraea tepidiphila]|jgi:putative photosynthetic complex assembly protein|uniref:photosynthetic complex assembly protein PuhC n=1 Tax=Elioraea tepidiphila TaxID=457934 RepID=UPI002FD8EB8E